MEGIYKINLIPSDLSTEETILQIADTLDNLNGIINDVFIRITNRIKHNVDRTEKLNKRIEISRSKVEKLTGLQKAVRVFSSAKYPPSIRHKHYESVFGLDCYKHEPQITTLSGKQQGITRDKEIQEKLHFFHVRLGRPKSSKSKQAFEFDAVKDSITTIGELLVYNTDESPYFGAESKASTYVPKMETLVENKSLLEAAPSSITNRDVMKREMDEYLYAPGMGMVPELEMPLDLPHLPGIAGDVQFSVTTDGSIAPSVVTTPVAPPVLEAELEAELPDLKELPEVTKSLPDVPDAPPSGPPSEAATRPPPPPPPPLPPPPPPMEEPSPSICNSEEKPKAPMPVSTGDAHSDLMAAIRKAGGAGRAKLKSATTTPSIKDTKPAGGDLMADLHAKLSMRRRGISGAERASGTVLHTLAGVIPEPGEQSSPQHSSSDEDWE